MDSQNTFLLTTFMSFGVSQKENKFTGLWKTAQVDELSRQIFMSVPDPHSVSSQSQQRKEKESWGYGDSRERRRKAGAMETAEREEGKLGLWRQQREKKENWGYGDSRERRRKAGAMETAEREGKLGLWRQHGNTVAKISLVYEISLQAL